MGEPRHRRSYLYDARMPGSGTSASRHVPGTAVRLFHNNTVRTIAPDTSGRRALTDADSDRRRARRQHGFARARRLPRRPDAQGHAEPQLLERLRANLRTRDARSRAAGTHAFAPIAAGRAPGRSRASRSRASSATRRRFSTSTRSTSRSRATAKRPSSSSTPTRRSAISREYQWFDAARRRPTAKTANVVATLRGTTNPELVYVVSSHYDSVEAGPGADDDASGTAALLEAARVLAGASAAGDRRLRVVHRRGSRACSAAASSCAARSPSSMHVAGALNNDMVGWTNDGRLDNTIRYSNPGIRDIQHARGDAVHQAHHLRRALLQGHRRRRRSTTRTATSSAASDRIRCSAARTIISRATSWSARTTS